MPALASTNAYLSLPHEETFRRCSPASRLRRRLHLPPMSLPLSPLNAVVGHVGGRFSRPDGAGRLRRISPRPLPPGREGEGTCPPPSATSRPMPPSPTSKRRSYGYGALTSGSAIEGVPTQSHGSPDRAQAPSEVQAKPAVPRPSAASIQVQLEETLEVTESSELLVSQTKSLLEARARRLAFFVGCLV